MRFPSHSSTLAVQLWRLTCARYRVKRRLPQACSSGRLNTQPSHRTLGSGNDAPVQVSDEPSVNGAERCGLDGCGSSVRGGTEGGSGRSLGACLWPAHHDPVGVSFPDGDLVDPDDFGSGRTHPPQLLAQVLLFQFLDRPPVQREFLGNILDGRCPAPSTDEEGKTLAVRRMVRPPGQLFQFHLAAALAQNPPAFDLQINPEVPAGQISNSAQFVVVEGPMDSPTHSAIRFFPRRAAKDPSFGITKDSSNRRSRTKAGEVVCVFKTSMQSHSGIMPLFFTTKN